MRKLAYSFAGLILAAGAAHAQPTDVPASDHAAPHADAAGPADAAQPATPAEPQLMTAPLRSVIVMIVLLKVAWM